ncbi:MAG TPA: quaternary ammonium compound efflux SMR transporter SugE [Legionella sp.]|nr:quaternary ammonium compound efflux SMR transporter SugE [Legionella sp.]
MLLAWVSLFFAGLLEVCWAIGLKYTHGFTKFTPSVLTALAIVGSMVLLAKAVQTLPIGTAYAIWVGIGALGTAVMGIWLFHEPVTFFRVLFLFLLLISIIGLKYSSGVNL